MLYFPKKARRVHLVCDKPCVESTGSGICGQTQNSGGTAVQLISAEFPVDSPCLWLYIFPSLEPAPYQAICQSNPWTCPRSQYWVCEEQFYTFLPSSISLEILSSLMRFLWIESSVFQRSEDFRLHIYKNIYLFIWLHRVLVASCGIFPCRS